MEIGETEFDGFEFLSTSWNKPLTQSWRIAAIAISGPNASFKTRFSSMSAHFIYDLMGAQLITIDYVPIQENPADALTK
eukprot:5452384-Prorocentrum_lima.AAC.1